MTVEHPSSSRRARLRAVAFAVLGIVLTAMGGISTAMPATSVSVVEIGGRGHGHGVGMSQRGARMLALGGATVTDILATFYPGTAFGSRAGEVTVVVASGPSVGLSAPRGGWVHSGRHGSDRDGFPVRVEAGQVVRLVGGDTGVSVHVDSVRPQDAGDATRYSPTQEECLVLCDEPGPGGGPPPEEEPPDDDCLLCTTTTTTAPPDDDGAGGGDGPAAEPAPSGAPSSPEPVWFHPDDSAATTVVDSGRRYRGLVEVVPTAGQVRARDHLDVEDYLVGMAEVPHTWPQAAIQAQVVAARTYALRTMAGGGEICDSERCQVYLGIDAESPGERDAVEATRGLVLTHDGALATTFYSASAGGFTASLGEAFGADYELPYLPSRRLESDDPAPWETTIALTDVGDRLGYPGSVTAVRVTEVGPSGRAVRMTLDGDAGAVEIDAQDFRRQLALRSTLFSVEVTETDTAPPPPPPPIEDDQLTAVLGTDTADDRPGGVPASVPEQAPRLRSEASDAGDDGDRGWTPFGTVLLIATIGLAAATLARWRTRDR